MINQDVNRIVWWIPFKKTRNSLRNILLKRSSIKDINNVVWWVPIKTLRNSIRNLLSGRRSIEIERQSIKSEKEGIEVKKRSIETEKQNIKSERQRIEVERQKLEYLIKLNARNENVRHNKANAKNPQTKIDIKDVEILSLVMFDQFGIVIRYKGKVYRPIFEKSVERAESLIYSGCLDELAKNGLIPKVSISDFYMDKYPLILEVETVKMNMQDTWSFEMLKSASMAYLKISEILDKYCFKTRDEHFGNMTISDNCPLCFDIGCFIEKSSYLDYSIENHFVLYYIFRLIMVSYGEYIFFAVDNHLYPLDKIPSQPLVNSFVFEKFKFFVAKTFSKVEIFNGIENMPNKEFILFLRENLSVDLVEKYVFNQNERKNKWTDYQSLENISYDNHRYNRVVEIINSLEGIKSIIDLGGNQGVMCMYIRNSNKKVKLINVDNDSSVIDKSYLFFKQNKQYEIETFNISIIFFNNIDTIKSDCAIAMDLTNYLLLRSNGAFLNNIFDVFRKIKAYANKYVLIEFMPLGLYESGGKLLDIPEWYTIDWFRDEFSRFFNLILEEVISTTIINGVEYTHRVLFVGSIKS